MRLYMENDVMVSIITTVYNHEEYIEHAIQSVLMQKVNFQYEFLIGEDCSSDRSYEICRKYADANTDKILLFHREKNLGGKKNREDLWLRSRGKYMIHLEGDDYWTDENKLQKQVDFLESHSDYIACAHKFHVVDRYEKEYYDRDFEIQFLQDNPYSVQDFERGLMISHLNSILFRNFIRDQSIDWDFWLNRPSNVLFTGDTTLNMILVSNGKMHCLDNYMSCYRKVTDSDSSSHSARQEYNNARDKKFQGEKYLEKEFGDRIDFSQREKNIFASAVFKWYRDGGKKNFQVVKNIIKYSEKPFLYTKWFLYLVISRFWLNHTNRKSERVNF